jgi:hypothetical protein
MEAGNAVAHLPALLHGSLPHNERVHNLFPSAFLPDDTRTPIVDGAAAESFQKAERLSAATLKTAGEVYAGMMSGDAQFRVVPTI